MPIAPVLSCMNVFTKLPSVSALQSCGTLYPLLYQLVQSCRMFPAHALKIFNIESGDRLDPQVRMIFLSDSTTDQPHTPCDYFPPQNATTSSIFVSLACRPYSTTSQENQQPKYVLSLLISTGITTLH